jgi:hypothetical protein
MPMIATTIINSIRVKPLVCFMRYPEEGGTTAIPFGSFQRVAEGRAD